MATDTPRTRAVHIYCEFGAGERIEIDHETRREYTDNGDTKRISAKNVHRLLADIGADDLPDGPHTVTTYQDLIDLICECADDIADGEPSIPGSSDP